MTSSVLFFDVEKPQYLPLISDVAAAGFTPILNHTNVRRLVERSGLDFLKWEAYRKPQHAEIVSEQTERICNEIAGLLKSPTVIRDAFSSASGNFLPRTGGQFVEKLIPCLAEEIGVIERLYSLVREVDLRAIVLGCDNSNVERALVLAARTLGIPTVQLAHGIYGKLDGGRTAGSMQSCYSDYVTVFCESEVEAFADAGVASEKVIVTGSPIWDELYLPSSRPDKTTARRALELDVETPTLLVSTSYCEGSSAMFSEVARTQFRQITGLLKALAEMPQPVQVILRPHPHELLRATSSTEHSRRADELMLAWLSERSPHRFVIERARKFEAIRAADAVLTLGVSTIVPEILILERPVMIWLWNEIQPDPFSAQNGLLVLNHDTAPNSHLKDLLFDEKARQTITETQVANVHKFNHGHDGSATDRVADFVIKLAQESAPDPANVIEVVTDEDNFGEEEKLEPPCEPEAKSGLHILQIVHDFPPYSNSGTELYTYHLSAELVRRGHRVTVLYPRAQSKAPPYVFTAGKFENLEILEFNIDDGKMGNRSDYLNTVYDEPFRRLLQSREFDLVHFQHFYGLSVNWLKIAKEAGLPVLLKLDDMFLYCRQMHLMQYDKTYCSGPESLDKCYDCRVRNHESRSPEEVASVYQYLAYRRAKIQALFHDVDFVHSPAQFLKDTCEQNGFHNPNFYVLPTGISAFEVLPRQNNDEKIRVGFLGEIDPRKGAHDFVEAIAQTNARLRGKQIKHKLQFTIHGKHFGNGYFDALLKSIAKLPNTEYRGAFTTAERPHIFAEIDLLAMPSLGENYPFILREALYAGVPVLATAIAGVPEIVKHGENGFLIQQGDTEAMADIFSDLALGKIKLREMNINREDIKLVADEVSELEEIYRSLLKTAGLNHPPSTSTKPHSIRSKAKA